MFAPRKRNYSKNQVKDLNQRIREGLKIGKNSTYSEIFRNECTFLWKFYFQNESLLNTKWRSSLGEVQ